MVVKFPGIWSHRKVIRAEAKLDSVFSKENLQRHDLTEVWILGSVGKEPPALIEMMLVSEQTFQYSTSRDDN